MEISAIYAKIVEHQNMAAYHTKEATRLVQSLEGGKPPSTRKGKNVLSEEVKARLIRMGRKNKNLAK